MLILRQGNFISHFEKFDKKIKEVEIVKILKNSVTVKYGVNEYTVKQKDIILLKIDSNFLINQGFEYIEPHAINGQIWRKESELVTYQFCFDPTMINLNCGVMGVFSPETIGPFFYEDGRIDENHVWEETMFNFCWDISYQHHFQNLCTDLNV